MSSASLALQAAVHGALTGDVALMALVTGIYDYAPEDIALPFVQIGEEVVNDWSARGMEGEEHLLTLHVWSQARGHTQAKSIMAAVDAALDELAPLSGGFHLIDLQLQYCETLVDVDSLMHHGVMRLRALTQAL